VTDNIALEAPRRCETALADDAIHFSVQSIRRLRGVLIIQLFSLGFN